MIFININSVPDQALVGATILGIINVVGMFIPDLDSKYKIGLALIIGVVMQYIPLDAVPVLKGIEVAFASSGVYKTVQVISARAME